MNPSKTKPLRFMLVGGATAGPIVPLLAVREAILLQHAHAVFYLVDAPSSIGQLLAKQEQLPFIGLRTGKFRRYFSWRNLFSPVLLAAALIRSIYLLKKYQITHVVGAGGYVQVPVIWAAWLWRLQRHIHQQDIMPTLANTLCAPFAQTISVTFPSSVRDFPQGSGLFAAPSSSKIHLTGNPCRENILHASKVEAQKFFHLDKSWPTIYVLGGGSGALAINQLIYQALPELTRTVQVIHSTGRGKHHHKDINHERYHAYEYIVRQDLALAAADIVIGRAGIYMLTELSNLGKVSMIIPMPSTHQEANAQLLFERQAAIVLDQTETAPDYLVRTVRRLLLDLPMQQMLRENIQQIMPHHSAKAVAKLILHD